MARQSDRDDEQRDENMATKGTGNGERRKPDAIQMLKDDHRRVEQLFDKYEQARRRAEKSKIAQQICLELTIHAELEEEIFYPACREHVDDPLLDEAQVEHDTAKILVAEIAMGTPQTDPFFDAKVMVLGEYIRHHVQEEEKNADSIFAKALEGGVDTAKLGERMLKRREQLMDEFSEELLLPQPKALHVQLAQEEEVWNEPPGRSGRGRGAEPRSAWSEEGGGWEEEGAERGAYDERRTARGGREEESRGAQERQGGQTRGARARGGGSGMGRSETGRSETGRGGEEGRSATGRGEEHRGWRGDPKGHSEAARRGWEHRR
ncbi:hemerythrin domain-containing protein [Methylocystis parvus]|uniref:hemerythrin domain-containing protein n=1 Tax=Methylocystis parvus TaxID=134 RepID=UPI003C735850